MLHQLKNLVADAADLDTLVGLLAFGKDLRVQYADCGLDPPSWLGENVVILEREIAGRRRDLLEAKLQRVKSRREQLATPTEQRNAADAEIKELEAELDKE